MARSEAGSERASIFIYELVGKQAYSKTEDRSAAAMSTFDDTLPAVQADQTLDFPPNPESASSC
ncbi:hypothetical protein NC651_021686 [Populus alba x Populus x berolinensis]|nr:hypothetical protein NC651_021686 [Populus alba x Populus x berolinensis]